MAQETEPEADPTLHLRDGYSKGNWLEHLASLYQVEFSLLAAAVTIGTVAAPLVVNFLISLPHTCTQPGQPSCVTDLQLVAVPLVPLLIVMVLGYVYIVARVIGKYTRSIERSISGDSDNPGEQLTAPALSRLNGALFGGESRRLLPMRIFYVLMAGAIVGTIGATVAVIISRVIDERLRLAGYISYGLLTVICLVIYNNAATHSNFDLLLTAARDRDLRKSQHRRYQHVSWQRFIWLCILPRPFSVMKEQHALYIALVLALVGQFPGFSWKHLLLGLLVFELLLYQTRYLLNAIRENTGTLWALPSNRRNDPELPFTPLQRIAAVVVSLIRIVLFYWASTRFGFFDEDVTLWIIAFFFASFYAYEFPRELCRARFEAIMAGSPVKTLEKLPQEELWSLWDFARRFGWLSYAAVGSGYALRAAVGLLLASGDAPLKDFLTVVTLSWALGTGGAAGGWIRELSGALSIVRVGVRPRLSLHPGVLAKPQVVWVATLIQPPDRPNTAFTILKQEETREGERLSLSLLPNHRKSPWRVGYAIAFIAIGTLGGPSGSLSFPLLVLMLLSSAILIFAPTPLGPPRSVASSWTILVLAVVLPLVLARVGVLNTSLAVQAVLLSGWVMWTARQEEAVGNLLSAILGPKNLENWVRHLLKVIGKALEFLLRIAFGGEFTKALFRVFGRS